MIHTVGLVPCSQSLTTGEQPVAIYRRERDRPKDGGKGFTAAAVAYGDVWYVATKSVDVENDQAGFREVDPPELAKVHHEDFVRIPLFRYYTPQRDLRYMYGMAAQIGAAAREALPPVHKVLQLHLALGEVFDRPEANQLEFYLGIAFRCLPVRD